ncbi:MAG: hypothetical protein ACE5JI_12395, partial [Acidobacteriota bacterium]
MTRTLTTATKKQSKFPSVAPVLFVELALDSGFVRVNSSDRDLVFSSSTFLGIGRLGRISSMQETSDLKPTGVQMSLSGIPWSHVSMVLNEPYQGRTVKIWLGFLDSPTAEGGPVGTGSG